MKWFDPQTCDQAQQEAGQITYKLLMAFSKSLLIMSISSYISV